MQKSEIRQSIHTLKKNLSSEERAQLSLHIQNKILQHPAWKAATIIYLYAALPDEVDTTILLQQALAQNKKLMLPRVEGENLLWLPVTNLNSLSPGSFHIMEPKEEVSSYRVQGAGCKSLIIIPGVAFSPDGKRLGRGKGFYDRFLAKTQSQPSAPYLIGLCFPFQIIENLPTEPHDIPMDEVIY